MKNNAEVTGVSELSKLSLQVMKEISDMLVHSTNCTCVLQEILISLVENTNIKLATVFLKNEKEEIFILSCSHPKRFQRYKGLYKSEQFSSCFNETDCYRSIFYHSDNRGYYFYTIPLPFQFDKKTNCIMLLISNEDVFSEEDLCLLKIFSNQIGLSIENELMNENGKNLSHSSLKVLDSLTEGVIIINNQKIIFSNAKMNSLIGAQHSWNDYSVTSFCNFLSSIAKEKLNVQLALDTLVNHSIREYHFLIETTAHKFLRVKKFSLGKSRSSSLAWGMVVSDFTQYKNSDKLKDDLIATVSHELRTPLTSIKGNASALLRTDIVWPLEDQLLFTQDIYEEADRLNDLIGKLLDFSKINAGALRIDPRLLTVKSFLSNLTKQLSKRYRESYSFISVNVQVDQERMKVDEQRLIQVFFNLIDNAFKHNSYHVPIFISVQKVDHYIQFTVKDEGKGIPQKSINKIFDRYYQRDFSTGLGLGLAICKGFVTVHHGEIWAESRQGSGSSFHFTIPIARG